MTIATYLADDHAVVTDGLRALLEAEPDIKVVGVADNGRTALREIGRLKPDAVILDIAMPEMNGIETARLIHERHPAIRIIALSMYANTEFVLRALRAGARGYVLKASAGREVIDALRAVHAGRRYLSQRVADAVIEDYIGESRIESRIDDLSSRERQVLQLIAEGEANAAIAQKLALSPRTVETYRSRLMRKLNISNLPELVKFAIKHGVTRIE